mmetsp:Transcript_21037/g.64095  ORF Transcript_21037/g.64095 Transcript_21037/m.64095 type:complete len:604 (-) Transcript_21037:432-2243(-)
MSPKAAAEEAAAAEYDYVICGGGLAGCVLANRLSSAGKRVLMLEAGGADYNAFKIKVPAGILKLFQTEVDWTYFSEGEKACQGRPIYLCRGKVLGGSSCTNVLLHHRGSSADYDAWGVNGWTGEDVLPFFVKSQDDATGRSKESPLHHGTGGEWSMDEVRYQNVLSSTFLKAAQEAGVPLNDDFNNWARPQQGAGRFQVSERNGARCSGATAYLEPVLKAKNPNLAVATGAKVQKVNIAQGEDGPRAQGVVFRDERGNTYEVNVKEGGEVLLCGGAITSPHWLLLSGVGPKKQLAEHGIECVVDSSEVGQNLQDHPAAVVSYGVSKKHNGISVTSKLRLFGTKIPNLAPVLQWLFAKRGLLTSTGCDHGAFYNTNEEKFAQPDLQMRFLAARALSADGMSTFTNFRESSKHPDGFSFQSIAVRPKSRGSVSLRSSDPENRPCIDCGYLNDEDDVATLREGIKLGRRLAATAAFAPYRGEEVYPGADVVTDEQIDDYIRSSAHTANAITGTCAMGTVVDENLRVKGVAGLRVCDASTIPVIPGGQTATPTVMIAERAAQFILNPSTEIRPVAKQRWGSTTTPASAPANEAAEEVPEQDDGSLVA